MNKTIVIFIIILLISTPFVLADTFSLSYDNNGNLIDGQYFTYEYNEFNQLAKIYDTEGNLIEEYGYDHEGIRIKKIEYYSDSSNVTTYYPFPELVSKVNSSTTENTYYYFLDGDIIARDDPNGSRYYYHNDHLGSHTLVTDSSGSVVEETEYKPFGGVLSGGEADFLYTGKELDDTNLYYYGARYYNTELRQFTQPDTVIPDIYNPQSLNRYSYVLNNPYKYTDPTGHYADTVLDIASISWSIHDIYNDPSSGWNWAALGADIVTTALPFIAGGGIFVKGAKITDKVVDGGKVVDKGSDVGKLSNVQEAKNIVKGPGNTKAGKFIVDKKGNVLIEPKGGFTKGSSSGDFINTHFKEGGVYQQFHLDHNSPLVKGPHGHTHLPNTKYPSKSGYRIDINGNIVEASLDTAHWYNVYK